MNHTLLTCVQKAKELAARLQNRKWFEMFSFRFQFFLDATRSDVNFIQGLSQSLIRADLDRLRRTVSRSGTLWLNRANQKYRLGGVHGSLDGSLERSVRDTWTILNISISPSVPCVSNFSFGNSFLYRVVTLHMISRTIQVRSTLF